MILEFRTSTYALNIYVYGNNRLTARTENGVAYTGVAVGYYTPVETYAATDLGQDVIDNALTMTWINATEYAETIALIPVVTS